MPRRLVEHLAHPLLLLPALVLAGFVAYNAVMAWPFVAGDPWADNFRGTLRVFGQHLGHCEECRLHFGTDPSRWPRDADGLHPVCWRKFEPMHPRRDAETSPCR